MLKSKAVQTLLTWFIALLVMVILVLLAVRLLLTPWFPAVEYRMPGFPDDPYGFTLEQRLEYSRLALDYLLKPFDRDRFRESLKRARRIIGMEKDREDFRMRIRSLIEDVRTNSLIVVANDANFTEIQELAVKLDGVSSVACTMPLLWRFFRLR